MSGTNTEPRVVVFGEALTDLVRVGDNNWTSFAGGSCWNVARAVSRLGIPAAWAGAVSADLFGGEIVEQSRQAGLDMRFLQVVDKPPLIAVVHQTRPPQYFFLGTDSADLAFDEQRLPPGWEDHCEFAHFGCISLVREPLGSRLVGIAERLSARGIPISFDPNIRNLMGPDYSRLFERMARLAAVIKLSDEDLAGIYPGRPVGEAIAHIRALAPRAALLFTRGAEGLRLYAGAETVEQPAFPAAIADSVGAGDCCLGAYVVSSLSNPSAGPARHARFAAAAAAVTCAHAGAYAPAREEVARKMGET